MATEHGITPLMLHGEQRGARPVENVAGSDTPQHTRIGEARAGEGKTLRQAGLMLAGSDILWVIQAAIIAYALATMLKWATAGSDGHGSLPELLISVAGIILVALVRIGLQGAALNQARRTCEKNSEPNKS